MRSAVRSTTKFEVGDEVWLSEMGMRQFQYNKKLIECRSGVVVGVLCPRSHMVVVRLGHRKTTDTFHEDFWERETKVGD